MKINMQKFDSLFGHKNRLDVVCYEYSPPNKTLKSNNWLNGMKWGTDGISKNKSV